MAVRDTDIDDDDDVDCLLIFDKVEMSDCDKEEGEEADEETVETILVGVNIVPVVFHWNLV